jgi:tetratricopeptide (TPR) repeat protein
MSDFVRFNGRLSRTHALTARLRLVFLLLVATVSFAWAGKPADLRAGEVARLPEYCQYTQSFPLAMGGFKGGPSTNQRPWVERIGDTFWALHHYCWALVNENRAAAAGVSRDEKRFLIKGAISDCNYVLANATADFPLLPEIKYKIAVYNRMLGNDAEAYIQLESVIDIKPDYWPAYRELTDLYLKIGKRQAAVEVLERGLRAIPGQPDLLAAMEQLKRNAGQDAKK